MTTISNDTTKVELPVALNREWQGTMFSFNVAAMDESWIKRIFDYGLRVVNDAANSACKGELPSDKVAYIRELVAEINEGKPWEGSSRGGTARLSAVDKRMLKLAKEALMIGFKRATAKNTIKDMCAASDKVAHYFDGSTWLDDRVIAWADAQGVDYLAVAQKQLDDEAALADSIDF